MHGSVASQIFLISISAFHEQIIEELSSKRFSVSSESLMFV